MLNYLSLVLTSLHFFTQIYCHPHHSHDHTDHCHFQTKTGVIHIDVGQTASIPGHCMSATCEKNLTITEFKCAEHRTPPVCTTMKLDFKKQFPECCPYELCTVEQETPK